MKQQKINEYMHDVIIQCKAIKLPVSRYIEPEVLINRRAKSRFGACRKVGKGFVIEINEALIDVEPHYVKNILAHEVLHTCKDCQNHGKKWKEYAEKMNATYGYNITTTSTYEKMGLDDPEKKKSYRYMIQCQSCGNKIYRQRKSNLITNTDQYRCKCGGFLKCYTFGAE